MNGVGKASLPTGVAAELVSAGMDSPIRPDEPIEKTAARFEGLILNQLLKAMRATVPEDGEDSSFSMQMSYDLFDQSLSETSAGSLGLASMLTEELSPGTNNPRAGTAAQPLNALPPRPSTDAYGPHHHHEHIAAGARPREGIATGIVPGGIWSKGQDPVDGVTSSDFGWREHPINGTRKFHTGKDIAAPEGSEIRAVQDGTVVFAGKRGGYGKLVELKHADGSHTRYAHASRIHVKVGDRVETGEAIADVGSTGSATGPHLHFEARVDEKPIDPDAYLKKLREE